MTLTKAELADLLFEQLGHNKDDALDMVKRRGNRRYYQHHEVLLIRRIRDLLYEQGFTINGARHRLEAEATGDGRAAPTRVSRPAQGPATALSPAEIRQVIEEIRQILRP